MKMHINYQKKRLVLSLVLWSAARPLQPLRHSFTVLVLAPARPEDQQGTKHWQLTIFLCYATVLKSIDLQFPWFSELTTASYLKLVVSYNRH